MWPEMACSFALLLPAVRLHSTGTGLVVLLRLYCFGWMEGAEGHNRVVMPEGLDGGYPQAWTPL